ncbi:hypothetical protein NPIL_225911 [Nephila pilipes]|uniref:Uncharacterized protein n=1 Tax=Nephila pilipes TaxID=299642 RepID=A0A8X6QQ42_NEPPI|nr:hypothetical protein NPIL_225911 [Nephila pilipes]
MEPSGGTAGSGWWCSGPAERKSGSYGRAVRGACVSGFGLVLEIRIQACEVSLIPCGGRGAFGSSVGFRFWIRCVAFRTLRRRLFLGGCSAVGSLMPPIKVSSFVV